ncbi:DUF3300 domain-containing protein [Janthinobacterium sp. PC23-8]|uniref:DUF3300 domain-containing protein n=1 Tax=Janthinobacterium sp. PC23-8 TaxID=2012679 RepID=UPI000B9754C6|nr:DUF3300 domain-containing protein [Janthinobacterium sp. PC23-8]OYO32059.1 hypothetical protein CD932_13705 [Janthinobacterium sp. PC23-8]
MGAHARSFKTAVSSSLILSLLVLAGCGKPGDTPQTGAVAATPPAPVQPLQPPAPAPYTPPSADQLAQMVAPIALFPDKLVGQVLAGATYPEQVAAANEWLVQHPSLKGAALQTAEASQPWDVSIKSLTAFPTVLGQMANNGQWTTALGTAYVNDPTDVMNAIQLLRSRARQAGNLKTSQQLRVSTLVRAPQSAYVTRSASYPAVIAPPPQTIVIEPAAPDIVYVPQYNPTVVYGVPVPLYPGWVEPRPAYGSATLVTTGALSFGIGVLVGAAVSQHYAPGWHAWGVNWGAPAPYPGYGGAWRRPAVVYNKATYVSKSVTVVNRVNNINVTNNNYHNNNYRSVDNINTVANRPQNSAVNHVVPRQPALMTMPHFTARDTLHGARPLPPAAAQPAYRAVAPQPQRQPAQMERRHAEAMALRMAQERSSAPVHLAPAMQQAPLPHREADPGHGQPQRNHQDMQAMHAMHAAQARPAVQHPYHHVESHEQSARHQQDRDRRDAHERRG